MRYNLVLLILLYGLTQSFTKETTKRGPFKSRLMSIAECFKTSLPVARGGPFTMDLELSNGTRTTVRGNMTVAKNNLKYLKYKMVLYLWEEGEWRMIRRVPGWTCDRQILVAALTLMNIKYNKQKCSISEGFYSFKNIDMDWFFHFWSTEADYGKVLISCELTDKKNTYLCYDFINQVIPL